MRTLPGVDSLVNAPRATQVDAIVSSILQGAASPETRKILMSGEHPFAASAAQQAAQARAVMDSDSPAMDDVTTAPRLKGSAKQQGAAGLGRGFARNPIIGPTPTLTGLAQIVGFALGSPEFQRR